MTEPSEALDRDGAALWVEDLVKVYADGTRALRDMSLHVPAGCFFGLLGPNGSGKTTLIGAICGLVRAPAGRVFVSSGMTQSPTPNARGCSSAWPRRTCTWAAS